MIAITKRTPTDQQAAQTFRDSLHGVCGPDGALRVELKSTIRAQTRQANVQRAHPLLNDQLLKVYYPPLTAAIESKIAESLSV